MKSSAPQPIRILLVDDHKSFIDGLRMVIEANKERMEVVATANNRANALSEAARVNPDLTILDVDLDGEDGIELIPDLVASSQTKILMLTGTREPAVHNRAIMAGARGILLKNESGEVILKAVEKVNKGEIWLSNDELSHVLDRLAHPQEEDETVKWEREKIKSLTDREREVIRAVVQNDSSTNGEIAARIYISESTLKNHISTIYSKLELRNRIDLLKYALSHKLDK